LNVNLLKSYTGKNCLQQAGLDVIVLMLFNHEPSITKDTIVEDGNPKKCYSSSWKR